MIKKKVIYGCEAHGNKSKPYMTRYTLFECKYFQVCLHHFFHSDWTDDFHDHPWPFVSLILWRGYIEETPDGKRRRRLPGMILFRKATHQHRVELINEKPAITLVLMGKRVRQWYFYCKGVKIWFQDYFIQKGC